MTSLFGREEFDPPTARMQDPWTAVKLSGFWILLSFFNIGLSVEQVSHSRSSGRPVSMWMETKLLFWAANLMFWFWSGWSNFQKYRDQHHGDEAAR